MSDPKVHTIKPSASALAADLRRESIEAQRFADETYAAYCTAERAMKAALDRYKAATEVASLKAVAANKAKEVVAVIAAAERSGKIEP